MSNITQFTGDFLDFFKVLSDQTRLQILDLLRGDKEITQKEIEEKLTANFKKKITQSTISQQLKTLIDSNLIVSVRKDNKNFYRIKNKEFFNLFNDINNFISRLKDLDVLDTLF
jgi:DNA-binding transcriptional ArsR family regulator